MSVVEKIVSKDGTMGVLLMHEHVITRELLDELEREFAALESAPLISAIVVRKGAGSLAFSFGADLKLIAALKSRPRNEVADFLAAKHSFFSRISSSQKLVIAAVEGHCLGGGLELALACHCILADRGAMFGFPEVGLGIIPGLGGTQRLPRKIGASNALKLILSARNNVSAEEAVRCGLVDALIEGDPVGAIKKFAAEVRSGQHRRVSEDSFSLGQLAEFGDCSKGKPASAVAAAFDAIEKGSRERLQDALTNVELPLFLDCLYSEDGQEGIAAFLEKRIPWFKSVIGVSPVSVSAPAPSGTPSAPEEKTSFFAEAPPWESDECRMLRNTVREFAAREIAPNVDAMEERGEVPRDLLTRMADQGFFGIAFDEKYGGSGLGKIGACVLAEELGFYHASTAVVVGAHTSLGCEAVSLFGNEDQKQRYLVPGIAGEKIGALATTEPKVGSDIAAMKTLAREVDGGWLMQGTKQFITNGGVADFVVVFAQTDPLGDYTTLAAFIVDSRSKGFQFGKPERKVGIHASSTTSVFLDDVFVPRADLLGNVGEGFKMVMKIFNHSRVTLSAGCIGFIRRAFEESVAFAKDRVLFGEPMWKKQLTHIALGEMEATRYLVESAVYDAAWRIDRGLDLRNEAAAVKYFSTELASRAVDMAVQLHGGAGFIEEYPIARLFRDVRVFRLFEGTSQVQLLTIAKGIVKKRFL